MKFSLNNAMTLMTPELFFVYFVSVDNTASLISIWSLQTWHVCTWGGIGVLALPLDELHGVQCVTRGNRAN